MSNVGAAVATEFGGIAFSSHARVPLHCQGASCVRLPWQGFCLGIFAGCPACVGEREKNFETRGNLEIDLGVLGAKA
ncbi:hypothetical protein SAMN05661093_02338 [Kibdelosporangium aridum]|uniref:Uncharacterized protein n=1 Tax=Kibdelosporangium aridum TaxID=2030 RepID=A0A1Y5XFJ1_KIBAR|nr:hypothetical protein SAMN05661093_02338 [Kibdelosporangium aridum]